MVRFAPEGQRPADMLTDSQGLPVANADAATIEALDHVLGQWLGYGKDFAPFMMMAERASDVPLVQMQAAALNITMDEPAAHQAAGAQLALAQARQADMTARERAWLQAISAWHDGALDGAAAAFEEMASAWPRDLFAAKLGQLAHFNLGNAEGMLRISEAIGPANRDVGYVYGMRAFALEELNRLDEAEADARRAVAINRSDPWAHHAAAHVMETQGRIEDGIAWMEGLADTWDACNSFMYTHNWWHTALFYIDSDRPEQALALYDNRVWGVWKTFCQDQINAISLLARLELRGVDAGDRWRDIATYLVPRLHEHFSPFLDLQYLYGLARAGEGAAVTEMLASLEDRAGRARPFERTAWVEAAVPAAHGVVAHAKGDWGTAARLLGDALPHLQVIGGSHAQRALFGALWLDALIKAQWNDRALAALVANDHARGNIAHTKRDLATIYDRLGRAEDALTARQQAERLTRRYRAA
ncbi:tetratricopeptide repeat protein [Reyranella sp. CPCC 100927]|uniref:tetratricopeptide repeat protein n=1 Tax=Reyranella sp. CPCC 100927 TaxID=2599616 RepID=UPI0011B5BB90|nr:tetratricopeptide repeat protein [Reyranella sp. CPCC 100927]TWS99881.1 tetratricopeptide repeat protein [Reyranella sp. CPCC 100927]